MKKALLVILDGFGEAPLGPGNAIALAKKPNLERLRAEFPFGILQAGGEAVGLVEGSMGGSEVGHFTIGSGRVTPQFLLMINRAIQDGSFFENQALASAFDYAKKTGKALHLMGMISDKGVHSHVDHLFALLEWAKKEGLPEVYIHCIGDGRDVEERSIKKYLRQLQAKIDELGVGKIATVIGRYYAMDRDKNWDRTKVAYDLIVNGKGEFFDHPVAGVEHFYVEDPGLTDYYLPPILVSERGMIKNEDAVIFFNYRTDRTRQLTAAFVHPTFEGGFDREHDEVNFVCMGPYSDYAPVAFNVPEIKNNLGRWFSEQGVHQLRIAETEKYAHVTFFFNSQVEHAEEGEDRILVDSPKVPSYAEKPEMSAVGVTDKVVEALREGRHEAIIVNYANCDLVGHSGDLQAATKAVEVIDECMGRVFEAALAAGYTVLLTGDHGNADDMLYPDGSQRPAHSMNPVIFMVADPEGSVTQVADGGLEDVAPTMLKIMGLEQPSEMTGRSLI
ncbi:MAG: 2,3-bisphosphoglycerate-independent phosphoglycerate mutase [Candidatus Peregrinibacteria bacterium]|nr:2,3-bisphosphoglycerate-independent phosphoglycerate mutase [Candidatus Peregrinibacteria bacterium]